MSPRALVSLLVASSIVSLVACDGDETGPAGGPDGANGVGGGETSGGGGGGAAGSTAGGGSGAGGDAAGGSAGASGLDPSLYDCSAKKPPERPARAAPLSCLRDASCKTVLVSAHRGSGSFGKIAPEDTVHGVWAGIALGADLIETDPRPTKDEMLVNLHDTTVDRVANGTGEAADLTLAELQALTLKPIKASGDFSCARIATLDEILLAAKGRTYVLVDANKTSRVDLLVAAIQRTETEAWAIFDTSDDAKIQQALALEPALLTMIRVKDEGELSTKLALFVAHPPIIVEVDKPSQAKASVALGYRTLHDVFGADLAAQLTGETEGYQEVLAAGVDIFQSDRPDLCLSFLGR